MNELGAEIHHDAQIRQWATGVRQPSAANCVYLEKATDSAVDRREMRSDWQAIWPELIGTDASPSLPEPHSEAKEGA